jgi:hypothetical protein
MKKFRQSFPVVFFMLQPHSRRYEGNFSTSLALNVQLRFFNSCKKAEWDWNDEGEREQKTRLILRIAMR